MNKRQKEVQQRFLDNEKAVLKQLEKNYKDALEEINEKIAALLARQDADMQHVIYQVEYQQMLRMQVQSILERLQANEFETISGYLTAAYEDGFIGTMYDLQGQGIPILTQIDEEQVTAAIQHETPLSEGLYVRLEKDIDELKEKIASEISRGISSAALYVEIARNIASYAGISQNKAMRIARTEAHRIQCRAAANAQQKAKEAGADIVKQWDATLDSRTRKNHRKLDGQIRELDEPFEVDGKTAMHPGDFGFPEEDIHCRCALLQRARWALDKVELETLKERADFFGIDKTQDFVDFRRRYLKAIIGMGAKDNKLSLIPEHDAPKIIKRIDWDDDEAVKLVMRSFESDAVKAATEMACVITRSGVVYQCFGIADRVFPDADLGDLLKGARVSHNHPTDETIYSFSKDDFDLFMEYDLDFLRGCDERYTYELTRNSDELDGDVEGWMSEENFQHCMMINLAKENGVGYKRWKNE